MRNPLGPRGIIGGIQGSVSTANLQQALETKGLTSANLAAALSTASPATPTTSAPPTPQAPNGTSTKT